MAGKEDPVELSPLWFYNCIGATPESIVLELNLLKKKSDCFIKFGQGGGDFCSPITKTSSMRTEFVRANVELTLVFE